MKKQDFKVTFLTDIVLNKTSNTEGKIENFDFITGSAFLGMAVNKIGYDFNIFHSGKVRFGEATPLLNGKVSFKVPFCFFNPKLDLEKKRVQNNHFIDYSKEETLNRQYKQIRSGYMTEDFEYFELDFIYTQKSAYNSKLRRSKDSSMFGYNAIKKGTTWKFSLKFQDDINVEKIIHALENEHFLGKSKTAQYGRIKIEKQGEVQAIKEIDFQNSKITYLYVNSSLALFDKNNMPTFKPTKKSLGIKDGKVYWKHTQIRTKTFTPYVSVRQGRDSARLIIEKGSVIALENASQDDIKELSKGVGGYLSEGYGDVLVNPTFLTKKEEFELKRVDYEYAKIKNMIAKKDENLILFLNAREEKKSSFKTLGDEVKNFVETHKSKFSKVNSSQWGNIRMMAQFIQDKAECIKEIEKYISHGTASSKWEDGAEVFRATIENKDINYIKLLAMKMAETAKDNR